MTGLIVHNGDREVMIIHSQAGFVSKLLKHIAKAWKAERGYR